MLADETSHDEIAIRITKINNGRWYKDEKTHPAYGFNIQYQPTLYNFAASSRRAALYELEAYGPANQ